jgi:3-hydroxyisobutyrate dehydrogenase
MTSNNSPLSVTILGTGIIGSAVARNLAAKGFSVRVWNRTIENARPLADNGITVCEDVNDALDGSGLIITILKDGPAVESALRSAELDQRKTAWIQLSTVGVDATLSLAALASGHGIAFYDAPVLGTRAPAEQGRLVVLASGPEGARSDVQSIFDAIGQRTIWVSETPGDSSRLKLALNAYVLALTHATAETLKIASTLGVDPNHVMDALKGGPLDSGYLQIKGAAMLAGDYTTNFSVENGMKDAGLVLEALKDSSVQVDLVEAGLNRFRRAAEAGYGNLDIAASFLV